MIVVRAGLTELAVAVVLLLGTEGLRTPVALDISWCWHVLKVTGVDDMFLQGQGVKGPVGDVATIWVVLQMLV